MTPRRLARLGFLLFLLAYGIACLRSPGDGRLLDGVDLAIHETGHLVFAPFGETLGILGGTLFQLIVPSVFVGYFLRRREAFPAASCLWWVAQNCWNVSVYVDDARAQELPLVGGGEHDWAMLLGQWGMLSRDHALAHAVHATGVLLFGVALLVGLAATFDDEAPDVAPDVAPDAPHDPATVARVAAGDAALGAGER